MRHVLSLTVQNVPGVLAHVAGMLTSRGYSIETLVAKGTVDPGLSRLIFSLSGDEALLKRASEQLQKLVPVVDALDINSRREMDGERHSFRCVACEGYRSPGLRELVDVFRGRVVDIRLNVALIEITGQDRVVEAFVELARLAGANELTWGGRMAPTRHVGRSQSLEMPSTGKCSCAV